MGGEPGVGRVSAAPAARDGGDAGRGCDAGREPQAPGAVLLQGFKAYLPLSRERHGLAFRFDSSYADPGDGQEVPFFMMPTLGGAKTIRGYREFRFRDRGSLLLNLEYRFFLSRPLAFAVFVDAGKVFEDSSGFDFSDLHAGYGVGFQMRARDGFSIRMDIAFSTEGGKFHISAGPDF